MAAHLASHFEEASLPETDAFRRFPFRHFAPFLEWAGQNRTRDNGTWKRCTSRDAETFKHSPRPAQESAHSVSQVGGPPSPTVDVVAAGAVPVRFPRIIVPIEPASYVFWPCHYGPQ